MNTLINIHRNFLCTRNGGKTTPLFKKVTSMEESDNSSKPPGGHLLREWHWAAFRCAKVKSLSCAPLFATPWSVATRLLRQQAMEFFRQEYWSGLPFPSPGDLPDPGIEPGSPTLQARPSHREALDGQKIQSNNKKWQEREKSMCTRP